jgi:hypothetical protein
MDIQSIISIQPYSPERNAVEANATPHSQMDIQSIISISTFSLPLFRQTVNQDWVGPNAPERNAVEANDTPRSQMDIQSIISIQPYSPERNAVEANATPHSADTAPNPFSRPKDDIFLADTPFSEGSGIDPIATVPSGGPQLMHSGTGYNSYLTDNPIGPGSKMHSIRVGQDAKPSKSEIENRLVWADGHWFCPVCGKRGDGSASGRYHAKGCAYKIGDEWLELRWGTQSWACLGCELTGNRRSSGRRHVKKCPRAAIFRANVDGVPGDEEEDDTDVQHEPV